MEQNPLKLRKIHHVQFWVGNALQAAEYYRRAFGFTRFAYSGLETGQRSMASHALRQGTIRLVVSSPLAADHPASAHIARHGDGVRDIAFEVDDAEAAFKEAVRRGAEPAVEPHEESDQHGAIRRAAIRTYGETIHSFISLHGYSGPFLPGYREQVAEGADAGLLRVDHVVGNVELGKMNQWADWYSAVLGFTRYISFEDKDISTEYSALMSIVMSDGSYAIKFPINEPAPGRRKSQIDEYLDFYGGPGVQHIAMLTTDIARTVRTLKGGGVDFLSVPESYYDALPARVGAIDEAADTVRELGILVDRDEEGYLLQLFTRPVEDRPTLFFEVIQRKGSRGFGKGNFKALFEAIEREQALRGNL
jgi:4-hydroxyphenylpyruvate dioxygenase